MKTKEELEKVLVKIKNLNNDLEILAKNSSKNILGQRVDKIYAVNRAIMVTLQFALGCEVEEIDDQLINHLESYNVDT